ncbi:tyrosine--tRNA ligase [candidate division WWE3 bacterium]|nr:tyrosine--tRNA ligase [candidate division WWE3 bacterium]
MAVNTDPRKIDEILTRGVHEIFTKEDLRERLLSGKQLHLKLGTDVTGPRLHLGHAVVHRKIRDFQELGHKVTLVIGDYTTLVGDHSDKVDMRAEITPEEIKKNEETYKEQFFKTVKKEQTEIKHNSDWLADLQLLDVINLTKQFTIAQMLDRETFKLRYEQNKPIGLDEFLYPLMQGYDSVALKCDVEFGGTDQTFNLLAGRKLMEVFDQKPQCAFVMRLLTGADGRPMGKSLKNFIPLTDNANDMYGKVMAVVDEVIFEYFELVTRVPMEEISKMQAAVETGENPMKFKKRLAREIVTFYHSKEAAQKAEEFFESTVQGEELPEEMPEIEVEEDVALYVNASKVAPKMSKSQVRRIIKQGGFEVNGEKMTDPLAEVTLKSGDVLKLGKRRYGRVK